MGLAARASTNPFIISPSQKPHPLSPKQQQKMLGFLSWTRLLSHEFLRATKSPVRNSGHSLRESRAIARIFMHQRLLPKSGTFRSSFDRASGKWVDGMLYVGWVVSYHFCVYHWHMCILKSPLKKSHNFKIWITLSDTVSLKLAMLYRAENNMTVRRIGLGSTGCRY